MELSHTSYKRIIRYISTPNCLSFLFSLSPPLSISLSSSPKTLNPSISLPPPNTIFHSHQLHTSTSSYTYSAGSPLDCSVTRPFTRSLDSFAAFGRSPNCTYPVSCVGLLRPHCLFRWFSVSSSDMRKSVDGFESDVTPKQVSEVIEVIRSGENDLEFKLNLMGLSLSVKSITEIFQVLNCQRISALHFFQWVQDRNPRLYYNSNVCSLIIDNCGWLNDYGTMISLLEEFKSKKICLNEKAFGFLPVFGSSRASIMESIRRLIDVLNEVGGSCRGSGICGLIKMLCTLDSFEMAKFVIEITERKVSYYNILISERCRRCQFEEARGLLEEMRQFGCDMNAKTYNYLLGSLCKNDRMAEASNVLEEMQEKGFPPDAVTFEICIYFSCRLGKLDAASQLLDRMLSWGVEPRLTTHAALVKGYFYAKQYEEAYKYVVGSGVKYKQSSNMIYSLLASLHQKKGDLIVAQNILIKMMEKGLKPNFPVYMRIMKRLLKTGRGHLAGNLKSKFSRFKLKSSTTTG